MSGKPLIALLLLLSLVSCTKQKTYYILTSNAWHITTETKLFHRGIEIGQNEEISFAKNKVLLKVGVEKYTPGTTDSLSLHYNDNLEIIIDVLPGKNGKKLAESDTIVQDLELKSMFDSDGTGARIMRKIEQKLDDFLEIDSVKRQQIENGK